MKTRVITKEGRILTNPTKKEVFIASTKQVGKIALNTVKSVYTIYRCVGFN